MHKGHSQGKSQSLQIDGIAAFELAGCSLARANVELVSEQREGPPVDAEREDAAPFRYDCNSALFLR